ncbi:MAG: S8 family serine peptidase, partial [Chloroflexota bacterium]
MAERRPRRRQAAAQPTPPPGPPPTPPSATSGPAASLMRQATVSEALKNAEERRRVGMPEDEGTPGPVVVELNLLHAKGLPGAEARFKELYNTAVANWDERPPRLIANTYYRCALSMDEVRRLVQEDQKALERGQRAIHRIWPDFPVKPLIDRSITTVKADAARRSYDASGADIAWAVIDSGIDRQHPHFKTYDNLNGDVAELHRDFTGGGSPLTDRFGHGTHVAGIIAGGLPPFSSELRVPSSESGRRGTRNPQLATRNSFQWCVGQRVSVSDDSDLERIESRPVTDPGRLSGVAPRCKLVSLKVLD